MKLRSRLALATLAIALPVLTALGYLEAASRQQAAEREILGMLTVRLASPRERAFCEEDPAAWGASMKPPPPMPMPPPGFDGRPPPPPEPPPPGPRPPPPGFEPLAPPNGPLIPRLVPLTEDLRGMDARFSPPERVPTRAGEHVALSSLLDPDDVAILVRTPWGGGPCAFVLATGTSLPSPGGALGSQLVWALPLAILLAAVMLSIGPIVRRIRRLTAAVHTSVDSGYATPITSHGGDEVGELAAAFERARVEVVRQLAEKEERDATLRSFLADTTHDVAIPLTVLKGHLAALRAASGIGADEREVIGQAMNEAHYIGALLANLTASAKLDAAGPELQRSAVDLGLLAVRVVQRHRPIAAELGVDLDVAVPEEPLVVEGEETLLEQAISNLVFNAVRHNRAGGHVAVLVDARDESGFRVRVLDDGPGIPQELMQQALERGFRGGAARSRDGGGQGLGLSIANRVARVHGMELALSTPEAGGLQVDLLGRTAGPVVVRTP